MIGGEERVVGEVRAHDHRQPVPGEPVDELQDPDLVAEVKMRGRLVQQQDLGFLRQRPGDHGELVLPSADLVDRCIGDLLEADGSDRLVGLRIIVSAACIPDGLR